jgi:hypothetical protein
MSEPRITYAPLRTDTSPAEEISALSAVYRLVLESANRNAAGMTSTNGGDEKGRSKSDSLASNHSTT